jgi:hypothetical protein
MEEFDYKKFLIENKLTINSRLQELNLGQKVGGMIDTAKSFFSNLAPSGEGQELKDELKKLGLDLNGITIYDIIYRPEQKEYSLKTADIPDLEKTVRLTQYQIDKATENVGFRAGQMNLNINDQIPKLEIKEFMLNLETGKYEFRGKKKENIELKDVKSPDASELEEMKKQIASPIVSISLEDLKSKARK